MVRSFLRVENFSLPGQQECRRAFVNPYAIVWGFRPDLNLTVVAPFVAVNVETTVNGEQVKQIRAGFADAQVFVKYDACTRKMCREVTLGWRVSLESRFPRDGVVSPRIRWTTCSP